MVNEALIAAEELEKEGISLRVIDMHTIKPIDEEIIVKAASETKAIITAEEHSVIGGLARRGSGSCREEMSGKDGDGRYSGSLRSVRQTSGTDGRVSYYSGGYRKSGKGNAVAFPRKSGQVM